jgi:hypothetical protein
VTSRFSLTASVRGTPDPGTEQIGGDGDDDEIVRLYRDPAGHPFCLFVRSPVP